jgi:hypothetical protein
LLEIPSNHPARSKKKPTTVFERYHRAIAMRTIYQDYRDKLDANEIPEEWPIYTLQDIGHACCGVKSTYYKWYHQILELDQDPQISLWFNEGKSKLSPVEIFGVKKEKGNYNDSDLKNAVRILRERSVSQDGKRKAEDEAPVDKKKKTKYVK